LKGQNKLFRNSLRTAEHPFRSFMKRPKHNLKGWLGLPVTKPEGEDFFIVAVRIENPSDPCWDDGFCLMGSWEIISRDLEKSIALTPKALGYRRCRFALKLYQGQEAREYMSQMVKDELRYAAQKRGQPNN